MQILIVEDDKIMADCASAMISHILADYDIAAEFTLVTNAYEAMAQFNESLPNLIILDILLSGPDGFTLLNELISYRDTSNIPIIILTSLDLQYSQLKHYGVIDILHKDTMTPTELKASLQKALNHLEAHYAQ